MAITHENKIGLVLVNDHVLKLCAALVAEQITKSLSPGTDSNLHSLCLAVSESLQD